MPTTYNPPTANYSALRGVNLIPGGAALEKASSQDIANELAGYLPQSFLETLQSRTAEQGAAGGFGVDSPNLNASALRAMGIQTQDIQKQGQADLLSQAQLGEQQSASQAQEVLAGQSQSETVRSNQAQETLAAQAQANSQQQWQAQLGEQARESQATLEQRASELAAQMGLSYSQLDEQQKEFINSQAQQLSEQQSTLAQQAREAEQANALAIAKMNEEMAQANQRYQLELSGQQGELGLARQAQATGQANFLYSTPPWNYAGAP
jgi:hypothetical protein